MLLALRAIADARPAAAAADRREPRPRVHAATSGPRYRRTYTVMGDVGQPRGAAHGARRRPARSTPPAGVLERSATRFARTALAAARRSRARRGRSRRGRSGRAARQPRRRAATHDRFPLVGRDARARRAARARSPPPARGAGRYVEIVGRAGHRQDAPARGAARTSAVGMPVLLRHLRGVQRRDARTRPGASCCASSSTRGWEEPADAVLERLRTAVAERDAGARAVAAAARRPVRHRPAGDAPEVARLAPTFRARRACTTSSSASSRRRCPTRRCS